jgi:predicted MFS family arabinose efflux permease
MNQTDASGPPVARAAGIALAFLFLINVVNYVDRQILSILLQSIKEDLKLSDSQLGWLTGFAFALFYAVFGIPLARLADRASRRRIIMASLAAWSAMTALCGFAQNFLQLMLARIGVAVGEAGASPPTHSMLADLYPHGKRAVALAIYSCGVPVGILVGLAAGGWINEAFDWRTAFFVVGLPGILLAVVFGLVVREPTRSYSVAKEDRPSIRMVFSQLWKMKAYRDLVIAATIQAFTAYGITQWMPSFFIRTYGLGTAEVGLYLGLTIGIFSGAGTFLGGWLADYFGKGGMRWYAWIPGLQILITIPFYFFVFSAPTFMIALMWLAIPTFLTNAFTGPVFGAVQTLAPPAMRAMAAAILLFVLGLVGQGGGPVLIGMLSDAFAPTSGAGSLRLALLVVVGLKVFAVWRFYVAGRSLEARAAEGGASAKVGAG